jgi:hypothetical protein
MFSTVTSEVAIWLPHFARMVATPLRTGTATPSLTITTLVSLEANRMSFVTCPTKWFSRNCSTNSVC